jgi:CRISPR-associated protein Csa3
MVRGSDERKSGAMAGGVERIRSAARSRARNMRFDITLIATFYNVDPLMPAALAFQPKKLILLMNTTEGEAKRNIDRVRAMFGKLVEIQVVKMPEKDIVGFATKFVEILDREPKGNPIVVSIGGGWRQAATAAVFGCYARPDRVYKIVNNTLEGNKVSELPKMGYSISSTKKQILEIQAEGQNKTVLQIAGQLHKTRGMIYQHLRELGEQGYVDDDFNITDAGRLALL